MNIKQRLGMGIATSALLLNALTPLAFADTTLTVSGNGSGSDNKVEVSGGQTTTVVQKNDADVQNNVTTSVSSGGNEASNNTGGDVRVDTGNATSNVTVDTKANANVSNASCNTCTGDQTVKISGNGADSENEIELRGGNETEVFQSNDADINNNIDTHASSGGNEAERNTGGDVRISTGNASADVNVTNMANANLATVGSNNEEGNMSLTISGNGAGSDNEIELEDSSNSISIVQGNDAYIDNDIDSFAKSGYNEAERNTGGNVRIDTGNASAKVKVNNLANFNFADAGCCALGLTATISGNGSNSENEIEARHFGSILDIFQDGDEKAGNDLDVNNDVYTFAKSGYNELERNTGPVINDPQEIFTGNASSVSDVTTSGNANVYGPSTMITWPDFDFDFDLSHLMDFFHWNV